MARRRLFARGGPGRAHRDRPGPGCRPGWVRAHRGIPAPIPTHSSPLQGLPGPASLVSDLLASSVGGYPVYPSPAHPWYHTPPVRPSPAPTVDSTADVDGTRGACTYDRFGPRVGEPRGSRTHPVLGSRTGYIQLYEAGTLIHGRLTEFRTRFTEVLLSSGPVLLRFY